MPIYATAGAKLYIGNVISDKPSDFSEADFAAETWTNISYLESLGTLGDQAEEITFDALGESRRKRVKGVRNAPTMEVVVGIDYTDAGQQALIAAEKTDDNYTFKIEFDDAPVGGTPSERYFIAMVGSSAEAFDTANSVMKLNASLWVNSNTVRVDAAETP
jgi:hypothetical protein